MTARQSLKSGLAATALGASALALGASNADAAITMTTQVWDNNLTAPQSTLYIGTPYKAVVGLNVGSENIRDTSWVLRMPGGTSYSSFIGTTITASLPTGSQDFFNGFAMNPSYNYVDSTPDANAYLTDNTRILNNPAQGVNNRNAFLGVYEFTPTAVATGKRFSLYPSTYIYTTEGNYYTIGDSTILANGSYNSTFDIVQAPEPSSAIGAIGALSILGARRPRRKN